MQLFSVDQQRSQALEAHAASFASLRVWFSLESALVCLYFFYLSRDLFYNLHIEQVPGNDKDSILIAFATKSSNAGQVVSKLHVIELGAVPGLYDIY